MVQIGKPVAAAKKSRAGQGDLERASQMSRARLHTDEQGEKSWHKTTRRGTARSLLGLIANFVRQARFENEQRIYAEIASNEQLAAHVPSVIDSTLGKELILEDVSPVRPLKDITGRQDAAEIIASLNRTRIREQYPWRLKLLMQLTSSRFLHALLGSVTRTRKYLTWQEIIRLCFQIVLLQSTQPKQSRAFLLHNDLHSVNILEDSASGAVYLIDFELAAPEARWILADIVFVAFNGRRFTLDASMLEVFLREIQLEPNIHFSPSRIKQQVRFGVILRVLDGMRLRPDVPEARRVQYAVFLRETLIPDEAFDQWFARQF